MLAHPFFRVFLRCSLVGLALSVLEAGSIFAVTLRFGAAAGLLLAHLFNIAFLTWFVGLATWKLVKWSVWASRGLRVPC